ncbi:MULTISPECIES: ATP synthase F1 subunit gamma [Sphingobacterium]|uniref:ATP synthase gamma chain n=1 Tax=Sphingobacterium litopenaei TaxID=2763500 RepID=A0ABR7YIC2_9SPHI|nr:MULTISPECIES: ATP synthase F1 subunit gamma [Sphingobacterium]MBD1431030.1 ATP synthase F1 subunit gamma [Sphingobacterium litopenaei]NGM73683.1 ATP synthase F1 subunit gamma [Sphingobacterium sp. SGL-16]
MANLKEVRNRITSVTSTQQITKAMKMVSAAKLKRATNAIIQLRPYANKLRDILAQVSASVEGNDSPYTQDRVPTKVMIVVVTSNRGLAGAFNANAIKTANNLIATKYADQFARGDVSIIAIGKRGHDFFSRRNFNVIGNHNELFNNLDFTNVSKVTEYIMNEFKEGNIDRVEVVYNQFRNAAVQVLTSEQLLPLLPEEKKEDTVELDYIIEPSKEKIIEELIPKAIKIQLYKAVLDSNASEHGARMTAMDKATENAGDLLRQLKLSYNQARQAAITTELTEIVSGAAALSNG